MYERKHRNGVNHGQDEKEIEWDGLGMLWE